MTTFPIRLGGLATQQADTIAADSAARAGGRPGSVWPVARMLRARLIGGDRPLDLVAVLDDDGRALDARLDVGSEPASRFDAPAHTKVYGRYLTPYLSAKAPPPGAVAQLAGA